MAVSLVHKTVYTNGANGPATGTLNLSAPSTPGNTLALVVAMNASRYSQTVTSVVAGSPAVYNGTFTYGASNNLVGVTAVISGFSNSGNNTSFTVTASSATSISGFNAGAANETHSASALIEANPGNNILNLVTDNSESFTLVKAANDGVSPIYLYSLLTTQVCNSITYSPISSPLGLSKDVVVYEIAGNSLTVVANAGGFSGGSTNTFTTGSVSGTGSNSTFFVTGGGTFDNVSGGSATMVSVSSPWIADIINDTATIIPIQAAAAYQISTGSKTATFTASGNDFITGAIMAISEGASPPPKGFPVTYVVT